MFFAGQISGVEGYVESIATGLVAGRHAVELAAGAEIRPFPRETAIGSLCAYVSGADARNYQPANITFDLLPALDEATRLRFRHDKKARHAEVCRRALEKLDEYMPDSSMSDLSGQIELFLDELRRQNASEHTVRNYASDLDQFLVLFHHPRQDETHA